MPDAIAPDGTEIYYKVSDANCASLVEVVLPAGRTSRPVRHRTVEEIWYFLVGHGEIWLRSPDRATSSARRVGPRDVQVIPTGWDFQFRATGDGPLRFLCYTSPPWPGNHEAESISDGGLGEPTV